MHWGGLVLFNAPPTCIVPRLPLCPSGNLDSSKLKGVSVCFNMLKAALCGNYVNFGVLRLYGDNALDEALNMFVKLLISIPLKNLLVSLGKRQ